MNSAGRRISYVQELNRRHSTENHLCLRPYVVGEDPVSIPVLSRILTVLFQWEWAWTPGLWRTSSVQLQTLALVTTLWQERHSRGSVGAHRRLIILVQHHMRIRASLQTLPSLREQGWCDCAKNDGTPLAPLSKCKSLSMHN